MKIKQRLDRFINHTMTEVTVGMLIILSIVLTILEVTDPSGDAREYYAEIGTLITVIFIIELSIRWYVARSTSAFFRNYWIDVVAVLPIVRPLRILRVLRLLRLIRLGILVSRRTRKMASILSEGLAENVLIFVVIIVVFLIGAIGITLAERQVADTEFPDFSSAAWWSLYTMMAGEPIGGEAKTTVGRVVTMVVMLGGFTLFAMFTGVVSAVMVDRLRGGIAAKDMEMEDLTNHVVICGWNRVGPTLLRELHAVPITRAEPIVIIAELEDEPRLPDSGIHPGLIFFARGDFTSAEMLKKARVGYARGAILLADKALPRSDPDRDARSILAALTIEKMAEDMGSLTENRKPGKTGIYTCVELLDRDPHKVRLLDLAGVEDIVEADEYIGHLMAHGTRARGLVQLLDELLTATRGSCFGRETVLQPTLFGHALARYKNDQDVILIAVIREGQEGIFQVNPPADLELKAGDELICIRPPADRRSENYTHCYHTTPGSARNYPEALHTLETLENHCIICGYSRATHKIIAEFRRNPQTRWMPIVVVAELAAPPEELLQVSRDGLDFFVSGDYIATNVLERVRVEHAATAILLADKTQNRSDQDRDARTILAALTIEKMNQRIHTCAELLKRDGEKIRVLEMGRVEDVVVGDDYVGTFIAQSSRIFGLVRVMDELLRSTSGSEFYKVPLPDELIDASFPDALKWYKAKHDAILIAVESVQPPLYGQPCPTSIVNGVTKPTYVLVNPPCERRLRRGDALFVIMDHRPEQPSAS